MKKIQRQRIKEIIKVFARYGFADVISEAGLSRFLPFKKKYSVTEEERLDKRGKNLRLALEELGPTFIKIGQFLSTRPDILPREIVEQLSKLQDEVPPFPYKQSIKTFEEDIGDSWTNILSSFDKEPVASASLSQVHKASTLDGREIVLKIQRPNIKEVISGDIALLKTVVDLLLRYTTVASIYDLKGLVYEFEQQLTDEIDFKVELNNIQTISDNLKEFKLIRIPKAYPDLSGHRVLAMDIVKGFKISNKKKLAKIPQKMKSRLAQQLLEAYLKQILENGFFHADPHPGNLLIQPDGKIALFDLGIIGRLDSDQRGQITKLLLSFAQLETVQITDLVIRMSVTEAKPDLNQLRLDIGRLITKYYNRPAEQINIGEETVELMKVVLRHNLKFPASFGLFSKTLMYIDNICRILDPQLNYVKFISRSSQRLLSERIRTQFTTPKFIRNLMDMGDLFFDFPSKLHTLIEKFSEDSLGIKFEHVGLEELERTLDRLANRMAFAIIVGSLIVGSGLVMRLDVGPHILEYSAIGIIGFLLASLLGFYLLYTIIRSSGMK